jgi:hypothetical protein
LDKVIGAVNNDDEKDGKYKYRDKEQLSKRKYIKFKKENDCCSIYFTIEAKDIVGFSDENSN